MEVQEIKKTLSRKDLNPIVTYLNLGTNFPTIHNLQTFHNQGRAPRFFSASSSSFHSSDASLLK